MPSGSESGKWLECNGQGVNSVAYPKLATLMGSVPDYQGVFLRGYGSITQTDTTYGNVIHSSSSLNVLQGDTIRELTGKGEVEFNGVGLVSATSGVFSSSVVSWNWDTHMDWYGARSHLSIDMANSVPTSNENRPVNKAVHYLIKAK